MSEFDAEAAIVWGGWDARYARVLDVQVEGDVAAALIDSNGDGADVNVDLYFRDSDGRWIPGASGNGSISMPGVLATWTDDDRLLLTRTDEAAE
ncbi:hypothetical protein ACFFOS_25555 [Nocardioides kongjuensis]|uniref:Uncharacterized protein n=1 Tax=Nocardioides kongjuensis TaxID=349522 RepID=A0A852RPD0_9ACTN|nr:hypothetical protein [Nocardioides kongjuensis]NYD31116.1 hypothetical protein [Nocardioides kongjuensis]